MEPLCRGESCLNDSFAFHLIHGFQEQAISRSYRIGQNLPVHVFRLVVKDAIEESIEKVSHALLNYVVISSSSFWQTQIFKREAMKDMYSQCPPIDKCTFKEWLAGP